MPSSTAENQDYVAFPPTGRFARSASSFFLFIDLVSSTRIAEQLGDLRFHELVGRFIEDVTRGVLATKGEIYKYVGDEVIVTWPMAQGLKGGRAVRCFLAAQRAIEENREQYLEAFGLVPEFRGGLHGGAVVAGEVGDLKREIAWLGDVVNSTARLLEEARKHQTMLAISEHVATQIEAPPGWRFTEIGHVQLRGRVEPVGVWGLAAD